METAATVLCILLALRPGLGERDARTITPAIQLVQAGLEEQGEDTDLAYKIPLHESDFRFRLVGPTEEYGLNQVQCRAGVIAKGKLRGQPKGRWIREGHITNARQLLDPLTNARVTLLEIKGWFDLHERRCKRRPPHAKIGHYNWGGNVFVKGEGNTKQRWYAGYPDRMEAKWKEKATAVAQCRRDHD